MLCFVLNAKEIWSVNIFCTIRYLPEEKHFHFHSNLFIDCLEIRNIISYILIELKEENSKFDDMKTLKY